MTGQLQFYCINKAEDNSGETTVFVTLFFPETREETTARW